MSLLKIDKISKQLRKISLEINSISGTSHIGGVLSMSDLITVLFFKKMNFSKKNFNSENRDRFILSKGHACLGIYVILYLKGIITYRQLKSYGKNNSILMAHISHKVPAVEFSTGSLGHGLPVAAGKSYYGKIQKKKWATYCIISDGELNEGSNWEALLFASHHKLNNLTVIIDYNKIQSFGRTNQIINLDPLFDKLKSLNLLVIEINGHNSTEIDKALNIKTNLTTKVIIANTVKGYGVKFLENKIESHYKSLSKNQLNRALKILK
tara:strand:+ start:931 stop:1731 length:801 start_codon:yes stop_codon:yes gene_type:complete